MSKSIIGDVINIAFEVGKFVADAITSGDEKAWRPIADILPSPLKSRVVRVAEDAKTRMELEKVLGS
jgi:hypothetical protein